MTFASKAIIGALSAFGAGGVGVALALENEVKAFDLVAHPPSYNWPHKSAFGSYDHASLRRGYQVYKNVCAACHSMKYVAYRELVNVTHTEDEVKEEAAEAMIMDGPNDVGEMFLRPGKLSDRFPSPYPNEEAARHANGGSFPPDLSLMTLARHGGEDYMFSLLTGYCDAPAGIELRDGLYYNPYFLGGAIGMAQALYNETIEYEDGTPATASQLAKDVCSFLTWTAQPEMEERKVMGFKSLIVVGTLFVITAIYNRQLWNVLKTRKIVFNKPKY